MNRLPKGLWRLVQHPTDASALRNYLENGGAVDAVDSDTEGEEVGQGGGYSNLLMLSVCSDAPTANFLLLLEKGGGQLANELDSFGNNALHVCARFGNVESMEILLRDHNADPNIQNRWGETPLHEAAIYGNMDCLKRLILHGGDYSLTTANGTSVLDFFRMEGREDLIDQMNECISEMESIHIKEPSM